MSYIEHIRVASRLFRITVAGILVDVRDTRSTFETQAILADLLPFGEILKDSQVRDAISSTYYNATSHESGKYPVGGTWLPDDFTIEEV